MKYWLLLLYVLSTSALACEVLLPQQLVILDEGTGKSQYTTKDCTPEAESELLTILRSVEGRITSNLLEDMLRQKGHQSIFIEPSVIHVTQFRNALRDQIQLPGDIHPKNIRGIDAPAVIGLAAGDKLEIRCQSCLFGLRQGVDINIIGFDGSNKKLRTVVDFTKMARAYRLTTDIPSFGTIDPVLNLREELVELIPHTELITDLNTLRFFKTNKPLKAGQLLRASDLNALNLVKAGLKTEVVLENSVIRIKTQGISRNNGALGEIVEVFHPEKNKKYQGKVVDINKVLVEL